MFHWVANELRNLSVIITLEEYLITTDYSKGDELKDNQLILDDLLDIKRNS